MMPIIDTILFFSQHTPPALELDSSPLKKVVCVYIRIGDNKLTITLLRSVLQTPNATRQSMKTVRDGQNQYLRRRHVFLGDGPFARYLARDVDAVGAGDGGGHLVVAKALAHHLCEGGPESVVR